MIEMKSNISSFSRLLGRRTEDALNGMGHAGKKNIDNITPVDTGILKSSNEWFINKNTLYFKNDVEYAPHVEYGTYKMAARPFTRNGIVDSRKDFISILLRSLGV